MRYVLVLCVTLVSPGLSRLATATTFSIADGDVAGLKSAFTAAAANNSDDEIDLATNGTYVLTAVDNTTANGPTGLAVLGADGHSVTVNGNGATIERSSAAGTPTFRLMEVSGNATINNLTLLNGIGPGGGIFNGGGTLVLQGCAFSENTVHVGGPGPTTGGAGLYNSAGTVDVTSCTFTGNTATGFGVPTTGGGAAIFNTGSLVAIVNSTFSNNVCAGAGQSGQSSGAAIFNTGKTGTSPNNVTVSGSVFTDNTANYQGGAIVNQAYLLVTGSLFDGNSVLSETTGAATGGAIFNLDTATIENCTFHGNRANDSSGAGGRLDTQSVSPVTSVLTVIGCTFSGNSSLQGSAIHVYGSPSVTATLRLGDTILVNESKGVSLAAAGTSSVISLGYNLSDDGGGGFLSGTAD